MKLACLISRKAAVALICALLFTNAIAAPSPRTIRLAPVDPTLVAGSSQNFTAYLSFFRGTGKIGGEQDITTGVTRWVSGDSNILNIGPDGKAIAGSPGTTTVTAESGPFRATTSVTVIAPFSVVAVQPADGATQVNLTTSISWTFNRSANLVTITVNTADTQCSGSLQLSADNFATCVAMTAPPSPSNGNQTFTVVPQMPLTGATQYQARVTTTAADLNGFTLSASFLSTFSSLTPPPPPTGVCANAGAGVVTLCWNPSAGATGYTVLRSTTSGMNYVVLATTAGVGYTDIAVNPGTTYFYVIVATNAAGASGFSAEVSATPQ